MENIVRTVYGAELQTALFYNLPITILPNSTLNEKFNINPTVNISPDIPSVKYIGIGNGGHKVVVGANNIPKIEPIQHTPRHAALYNQLPFVLRLPSADLTPTERSKYRLRKLETHNEIIYVAYYLKLLDLSATVPQLELRTVRDNITTTTAFASSLSDLNPTPPNVASGGTLVATGDYIAATAKIPFVMSSDDIAEFLNVCNIIYNDDNYAIISELALCSGVDRVVTGNFNGTNAGYTDAIGVQVISFINDMYVVKFSSNSIVLTMDAGSTESLLALA